MLLCPGIAQGLLIGEEGQGEIREAHFAVDRLAIDCSASRWHGLDAVAAGQSVPHS